MFSKKKTKCRVCGYRFTPKRENVYTAEEPRSVRNSATRTQRKRRAKRNEEWYTMKYMGSKSRIARHIVPIIQEYIDKKGNGVYVEPFVGGANVIDKIKCEYRVGADINKYLIALFRHIQSGGGVAGYDFTRRIRGHSSQQRKI